ncbi:phosphatase PAP2 family protein [Vogesella indigofera]|uniref:phosphatase PAP2 family protein n=1 Tax=Vogesella indigofera TaxID=45465 RepID=UPI00234F9540|nr:phosphatase PAP2 family protein [Vogesella indigofera]MDC7708760.1 phosphatase PAP2 family protein [Vogesella indigofera]
MSRGFVVSCALLALLLLLSGGNQALFLQLHHAGAVLPPVMWRLLSMFGEWSLVIAALLLLAQRRPQCLPGLVAAVLLGIASAILLKAAFAVPRPFLVLPAGSVRLLDVLPANGAFPSGHAIAGALLAGVLAQGRRWWWQAGLMGLVLLVCWSRIAIGVHWPLDVLVGAALGWAIALFCVRRSWRAWSPAWTWRLLHGLGLVLLLYSGWKLWRTPPNEAYVLFNLLALLAALQLLRPKKNGA